MTLTCFIVNVMIYRGGYSARELTFKGLVHPKLNILIICSLLCNKTFVHLRKIQITFFNVTKLERFLKP